MIFSPLPSSKLQISEQANQIIISITVIKITVLPPGSGAGEEGFFSSFRQRREEILRRPITMDISNDNAAAAAVVDDRNVVSIDVDGGILKLGRRVRFVTVVLAVANMVVIIFSSILVVAASPGCNEGMVLPFVVVLVGSTFRILSMIGTAIAQEATASAILNAPPDSVADDAVIRHERRMRYKKWVWWTRFGMFVTIMQLAGATYLMFILVKYLSQNAKSRECLLGSQSNGNGWGRTILILLIILVWFLVTLQCISGSDVLRWRSFYETHDNAWKAHYRELFDYGIREALCCLGRVKYINASEEDEVYSVARLLGDLVAYRASGTGHLELLAGLALLQRHRDAASSCEEHLDAPEEQIQEALALHQFAEAAYTGPLLDVGRNPILFPCAWLHRQGVLTPWARKRRPALEGDNWWRGHAAAFLKYVNQPPEALLKGRVCQGKCQAAYFIVVLHHLRSIVITVRGTETPEDLITDGLGRECTLSLDDLDGLVNSNHLNPSVKQSVISSFPHYGHSGIVEAARELFIQVDGQPGDKDATGLLSSLLAVGHDCDGYNVRIVGHSLGGAIATLLGLRLYHRYPSLHVYTYGTLPCVDSVIAEACSDFVTSFVYGDEFSARLSVNSIIRLRAAAIKALSQDSSADSAMICKIARRVLHLSKKDMNKEEAVSSPSFQTRTFTIEDGNRHTNKRHCKHSIKGGVFLCAHAISCIVHMPIHHRHCSVRNENYKLSSDRNLQACVSDEKGSALTAGSTEHGQEFPSGDANDFTDNPSASILKDNSNEFYCDNVSNSSSEESLQEFMHAVSTSNEEPLVVDPPEMFLPGLVIHIVQQQKTLPPLWKTWRASEKGHTYRAYIAKRENFKDIIVSPYMFLDHLPWRCHYAMQKVLDARKAQVQLSEPHIV